MPTLATPSAVLDSTDVALMDAVVRCDKALLSRVGADGIHFFVGERSTRQVSPRDCIRDVVSLLSIAQVIDVDAGWRVAGMQDHLFRWAEVVRHDDTMSERRATLFGAGEADAPVTRRVECSGEDEATIAPDRAGHHLVVRGRAIGSVPAHEGSMPQCRP